MPGINRDEYTDKEQERYDAAHERLANIIEAAGSSAEEFCQTLNMELAAGFPIDWPYEFDGWTLLLEAANDPDSIRTGLPQVLIEAGAEVNVQDYAGRTPLSWTCRQFVLTCTPEYLALINILLEAGARPELNEKWKNYDWKDQRLQARRDRLAAYVDTWGERRAAQGLGEDAAPGFDYAL